MFLNFCNIVEPFLYGFAVDIAASPLLWHDQSPCITDSFLISALHFRCLIAVSAALLVCAVFARVHSTLILGRRYLAVRPLRGFCFYIVLLKINYLWRGDLFQLWIGDSGCIYAACFFWFGPIILLFIQSCLISTRHLPGSEAAALAAPTLSVGRCFSSLVQFLISFCLMRALWLAQACCRDKSISFNPCLPFDSAKMSITLTTSFSLKQLTIKCACRPRRASAGAP